MDKKYWFGALIALGVIDYYAAYHKGEGTLSQVFRETFHTDTTAGKIIWYGALGGFVGWFGPHIENWPVAKESLEFLDKVLDT